MKASAKRSGAFTLAIKSREVDESGTDFKTVVNYIVTTDKEERQLHRKSIRTTVTCTLVSYPVKLVSWTDSRYIYIYDQKLLKSAKIQPNKTFPYQF